MLNLNVVDPTLSKITKRTAKVKDSLFKQFEVIRPLLQEYELVKYIPSK